MTSTDLVPAERDPSRVLALIEPASKVVEALSQTTFVPKEYRGKPAELLAAILTGAEMGLPPMTAMNQFHPIQGRSVPSATAMRAVVLSQGHSLWVEESSDKKVTVCGRRRGAPVEESTRVTWTEDKAKRAGLSGKENWRKYPQQMLIARATAELCRTVFADCLAGIPYTAEEVEDGDFPEFDSMGDRPTDQPNPKPKPRTRQKPAPQSVPVAPPPVEADPMARAEARRSMAAGESTADADDDGIIDAEIVEDDEPAPAGTIDPKDLRRIHAVSHQVWPDEEECKTFVLDLVEILDGGRHLSRSDIPAHVAAKLLWTLEQCVEVDGLADELLDREREVFTRAGGGLAVRAVGARGGGAAPPSDPAPSVPDGLPDGEAGWRAAAKAGGGLTALYRQAAAVAVELGVEAPSSAEAVAEAPVELRVRLWSWLQGAA